jgi:thioredoxin-related protein
MKKTALTLTALSVALLLQACSKPAEPAASVASAPVASVTKAPVAHAVAWVKPEGANMDALFAQSKASNKPLFLYWGAVWCPPCNQVKATVFNRPDFIERSQQFIPVYLDGDTPGAQKLASEFKVRGYPTMILFKPDRTEITRLPGEVDAQKYLEVLQLAMASTASVKETLQMVMEGNAAKLSPDNWRQLSFYSWELDEAQLMPASERAATLHKLASAVPAELPQVADRLAMKSLVASATSKTPLVDVNAALTTVRQVMGSPERAREVFDVLVNFGPALLGALSKSATPERSELAGLWTQRLDQFAADAKLSNADRLAALTAKVSVMLLDREEKTRFVADDVLAVQVRAAVKAADSTTTSNYERQAVIPAAADLLSEAGLLDESDALLNAELPKAMSPYYHMLVLSANAKARGDIPKALQWAERAWTESQGPATRLQWGTGYVNKIMELNPNDEARVAKAATAIIAELEVAPDTFYERNTRSLQRMAQKMHAWNKQGAHSATVKKANAQLNTVCNKLPAMDVARTACLAIFNKDSK